MKGSKMKRNNLLLVSWILSLGYFIYVIAWMLGAGGKGDEAEQLATGIVILLTLPHAFLLFIGLLFNVLGWAMNKRGFALAGAILYSVAMFFMIPTFFMLVIQTVLSYVGFAQIKKPISKTEIA